MSFVDFEWEHDDGFECRSCGTVATTVSVDYDRLGYAVCPACGGTESPLAE
jgi:translation initiation factor 2 beta subunit (eIF-2beta)/eIF-5